MFIITNAVLSQYDSRCTVCVSERETVIVPISEVKLLALCLFVFVRASLAMDTELWLCECVCEKQTLDKVTKVGFLDVCVCVLGLWLSSSRCTSSRNRADRILMGFDSKH